MVDILLVLFIAATVWCVHGCQWSEHSFACEQTYERCPGRSTRALRGRTIRELGDTVRGTTQTCLLYNVGTSVPNSHFLAQEETS